MDKQKREEFDRLIAQIRFTSSAYNECIQILCNLEDRDSAFAALDKINQSFNQHTGYTFDFGSVKGDNDE